MLLNGLYIKRQPTNQSTNLMKKEAKTKIQRFPYLMIMMHWYSKTCLIWNLCNLLHCVNVHWLSFPLDNFLFVLHCVIGHIVYFNTKFSLSAFWIRQVLLYSNFKIHIETLLLSTWPGLSIMPLFGTGPGNKKKWRK